MDPLNIAGLVVSSTKLAWDVCMFWKDSAQAPAEARELVHTVQILRASAENVRDCFLSSANPDGPEMRNYQSIAALNKKCERDLDRLSEILVKPPKEDASRLDALRTHFLRKMSEDSVRDIISGIKLCNTALQVQLQTLTILKMEHGPQHDHTRIKGEWNHVLGKAEVLLSHRPFRVGDPDWDSCLDDFVSSLREDSLASEKRSAIMHARPARRASYLPSPPSIYSPDPPRRGSGQSAFSHITQIKDGDSAVSGLSGFENSREDIAFPPMFLKGIVPWMLQQIDEYLRLGAYAEAAKLQKYATEYRWKTSDNTPVPTEVVCRDEMKLAHIYWRMGKQALPSAEIELTRALDRLATDDLDQPGLKNALLAELYHDLGRICLQLKRNAMASDHLTKAFHILVEEPSPPKSLLRSVGMMLYQIYVDTGQPHLAKWLDEHPDNRCSFSLKTLVWCQAQGFDTELETFAFDSRDTRVGSGVKGLSPLHLACKIHHDDILNHMLAVSNLDLEVTDDRDGVTPFLIACAQKDAVKVDVLLARGSRPSAVDKSRRNGLHLCQHSAGGTNVARRLLSSPRAVDVNALDDCQNAALHLAASMGNVKMVRLLLESHADPNISGPGGFTPMMAAVQATMRNREVKIEVLQTLYNYNADVSLRYSGRQTAADMANDGEVSKLLNRWAAKERQKSKPVRRFTFPFKN